jgi:uncharacterized protein
MKILVFSDIHGDLAALGRLLDIEADLYFAAGDMVSWGRGLDEVGQVLARRREKMYVLPGNHESEAMIEEQCERHGLNPFHGKIIEAGGYSIGGLGYSSLTPFNTPGEYTEEEMALRLEPFREPRPLIMVCHCPPFETALDRMLGNAHAGSRAIAEFIDEGQPAAFFCGHIHEAHGVSCTLGNTRAWNTGKQGVLLEFAKLEV